MLGTMAIIIAVSTLGFSLILSLVGQLNLLSLVFMVILFNVAQWLLAPYLVNSLYRVRNLEKNEYPHIHDTIEKLSARSGINTPKLMYSEIQIPNAFAYGSPLTGNHVAVTKGLLNELDQNQTEAVIGHELGHIKHRDVQVMMFISFLPSLFYLLARSFMFSNYYSGRERRDSGGLALVGGLSMLIYFFLLLFNLNLSRMREYYADQHSISVVEDGSQKLSEGLARISTSTWRMQKLQRANLGLSSFKTLFIADPDRAGRDSAQLYQSRHNMGDDDLVKSIVGRKITSFERFAELFSTHPNIVKRLRALNI
jgi:heat shock protein HtpX